MPSTPKAIYKDYKRKELDKDSAIDLLLILIENVENIETRIESIKILSKFHTSDEKTYKFLEHLLVSDLNEDIRVLACEILKKNYKDKILTPLSWLLEHEISLKCLIIGLLTLAEIDNKESKSLLIKKLNFLLKKSHKFNLKNIITPKIRTDLPSKELAEILINYYLLSTLTSEFGVINYKLDDAALITELDLSNVESFDPKIQKLDNFVGLILSVKNIRKLDLRFNHLSKIPKLISESIEHIDFSYNKIIKLPEFKELPLIKNLTLKSNRLRLIPASIGSLHSLENLNLRNNMLTELPSSFGSLRSLKILDLHGNKFNSILINLNKSIKELELGWNNFTRVPDGIKPLISLEKLGMGGNKLNLIPDWFGSYQNLKELDLYDNKIMELPDSIGSLRSLNYLNLRNNHLVNLPESFKNLKSLKKLNLSWNEIEIIPDWIGELSSLEELCLWGNKLEKLPESISFLSELKILDLNFNKIKELPHFIIKLKQNKDLLVKL